jgi:hypothetical protein
MARKSSVFLAAGIMILFLCSLSSAVVPDKINYQGKLTTTTGAALSDTVQMTFSIYPDTLGSPAEWTEDQDSVEVENGIFNVLLGSEVSIPTSVFDGTIKYLGIRVESDPEMRPLKPMVSVPYAYRAGTADGGVDCEDCDDRFVNVQGPDSVVANSSPALSVRCSASGGPSIGVEGYGETSTTGPVYGGVFTGFSAISGNRSGVSGIALGASTGNTYGCHGWAENTSFGYTYGGFFETSSSGTGPHFGVYAQGHGSSSDETYGSYGYSENTADGSAWGGMFVASSSGTGIHHGLGAYGYGSSSASTYGSYSRADNTSSGSVTAGVFQTSASGTGDHRAITAQAYGSSSAWTKGVLGFADNSSSGYAYGGDFYTSSSGTGTHYGVNGLAYGSSYGYTYGIRGSAENTSTGKAYGGYFTVSDTGTGTHYGVYGVERAGGAGAAVYAAGDMVASGAKPAVVRTSQGEVLLYAMESPEVWFEEFGEGKLENGKAHVELDPLFLETVAIDPSHPMKVFIQLQDDCKGTYVKTQTTGFDVIELQGGTSNASFSYRAVAKRRGYEDERMRRTDVGKGDPNLYPELWEEMEREHRERQAQRESERKRMEEETDKMARKMAQMEKGR